MIAHLVSVLPGWLLVGGGGALGLGLAVWLRLNGQSTLAAIVLAATVGGIVWQLGYNRGAADVRSAVAQEVRQTQQRLFRTAESLSESNARLQAALAQNGDLLRRLEDAARADPDNARPGVGSDGMRRINRAWDRTRAATRQRK